MNILLDTVAVYRAATSPDLLSAPARAAIEDGSNAVFMTLVSAWELTIKASLGQLVLPVPIETFFTHLSRDLLAQQLGIDLAAIAKLAELQPHHNDPFDRLIIAQALVHECAVLTSDRRFAAYGVQAIW